MTVTLLVTSRVCIFNWATWFPGQPKINLLSALEWKHLRNPQPGGGMPGCLLSTQSVIVAYLSVHCFRPIHQIFTTHSGHEIRGWLCQHLWTEQHKRRRRRRIKCDTYTSWSGSAQVPGRLNSEQQLLIRWWLGLVACHVSNIYNTGCRIKLILVSYAFITSSASTTYHVLSCYQLT